MANLFQKITEKQISRRTFLAATAAGTASLALTGCSTALAPVGAEYDAAAINGEGEWIPAACWFNCGYKCYNSALVVDNMVVRQKTDDTHPDSFNNPQLTGCLRGRAQQQQAFGADRLKYPMKRKHWEPLTGGDKSLRGKDEWVRISWDEALDYVAAELKNAKEKYGNETANLVDAKWIQVRPGTDTAFLLSVAYVMVTEDDPLHNPMIDWDFLNRCTVGFDAEHMPVDAALNENFKDYILGKYDNQPKTPQWTSEICGTPVEDIVWYAKEMRRDNKVAVLHASAQYSDIVLPIVTQWERQSSYFYLGFYNRDVQFFPSKVVEPLYEAKSDQWIGIELCKRLGVDASKTYPLSEEQQYFNMIAGTTVINQEGTGYETLVTITEEDLSWWQSKYGKVDGKPQQGRIGLKKLMEQGKYQIERHEGDNYGHITYETFVKDPENNPLGSKSGKFEIYCQTKADRINAMGRSTLKPYPSYIQPLNGYEQSFKDWDKKIKGDYPYQVTNPHYLRRAHTGFDYLPWLREACPNPVFISAVDAAEKGIRDGDTVLLTNPHGKVARQASISQRLMPGYIELPHGTWLELDEETGIDKSGSDNYLCAPATSGQGVSGYNTQLVNMEKYEGEPLTPDHLWPMRVVKL